MSELLTAVGVIIGGVICLAAFFVVLTVLFGGVTERIHTVALAKPAWAFLIGLINLLFFAVVALLFFSLRDSTGIDLLALPALLIAGLLLLALCFGLAAVAQIIGQGVVMTPDRTRQTAMGSLYLTAACLLPIVGWFLLLPYVAILGIGAVILALLAAWRQRRANIAA